MKQLKWADISYAIYPFAKVPYNSFQWNKWKQNKKQSPDCEKIYFSLGQQKITLMRKLKHETQKMS